ncbi:MAG: hypothetical protein H5T34_05550 [Candidatus Methanomethyliales bacterium]|nr:hypothetical protein [Candidatus Methanomethylicales archaeon]
MPHEDRGEVPHEEEHISISGYGSTFLLRFSRPFSPEEIKVLVADFIKTVEASLMKRSAKGIGHIKLYIKGRSGYIRADTIGSKYGLYMDGTISELEGSVQMTINTIAIHTTKEDVFIATREGLEDVAKRYGFIVEDLKS